MVLCISDTVQIQNPFTTVKNIWASPGLMPQSRAYWMTAPRSPFSKDLITASVVLLSTRPSMLAESSPACVRIDRTSDSPVDNGAGTTEPEISRHSQAHKQIIPEQHNTQHSCPSLMNTCGHWKTPGSRGSCSCWHSVPCAVLGHATLDHKLAHARTPEIQHVVRIHQQRHARSVL